MLIGNSKLAIIFLPVTLTTKYTFKPISLIFKSKNLLIDAKYLVVFMVVIYLLYFLLSTWIKALQMMKYNLLRVTVPFNSQTILSNSSRYILISTLIRQYPMITSVKECLIALGNKLLNPSYESNCKKLK